MQVAHREAVEPGPSVDLAIFEAIDSQLNKQVLVEVPCIQQLVPAVIDGVEGELQLGPEGSCGNFRHVKSHAFHSFSLIEVDDVAVCVGGELLDP